jgi:hypothetical protein
MHGLRARFVQPRVFAGLSLMLAGLVWATARGLDFYGLTPARIYFDLDQPPLLLLFAGTWFVYRRARR